MTGDEWTNSSEHGLCMGMWRQLWTWLTSSGSRKLRKAHPDLYPIDVDGLAKDLRLIEEAQRLGAAGLPSADASVISGPEAAVVQRVEKARQDYVDWAALRLNVLNTDLSRRNITQEVNRARQADKEFDRKASAVLSERDAIVRNLGAAALSAKAELDAFRTAHGLSREARLLTATKTYLTYAILLVLIVVEGVLNARFFAQGLDAGLLGGFAEAGILAALNVAVAFGLGKFAIRFVNHRRVLPKLFGYLAIASALLVMGCIGLGIAHYRDSLVAEIANPAEAGLNALLAHPFKLKDFFSWALFGISLAFGLGAMFDGLFSDDLYPGYGKISRSAQSAIEDYEEELSTLRDELEQLKTEELQALDAALSRAQSNVAVFESLIHDKQTAGSRLATALLDADNSLDALLKKFRTENEVHRGKTPRPAYFDRHPELRPIQLPDFSVEADERVLAEQRELVTSLLADEQNIRAGIQAAFNKQFDQLKPLDSHFRVKEAA